MPTLLNLHVTSTSTSTFTPLPTHRTYTYTTYPLYPHTYLAPNLHPHPCPPILTLYNLHHQHTPTHTHHDPYHHTLHPHAHIHHPPIIRVCMIFLYTLRMRCMPKILRHARPSTLSVHTYAQHTPQIPKLPKCHYGPICTLFFHFRDQNAMHSFIG